ncbi:MAG: SUMF1/EgtB/PvdO family nonheme iron enzyme, partial [Bacteroidales bacterium]|nr:SUMF1/EgtB/PvdO family nonheme iron enzyme [Bacteroidales bacterium]
MSSCEDYEVWVNDKRIHVYSARVQDPPWDKTPLDYGGNYFFASYDVLGNTVIRVVSRNKKMMNSKIFPQSADLAFKILNENEIVFQIHKPQKLIIEPDGKNSPLLLFFNPPENYQVNHDDPGLLYFGQGIHNPETIELKDNQVLYLAEGAIVRAGVRITGNNVTVRGRGIIDGSGWEWIKGPSHMISITGNNVLLQDIIILGSSHWTIVPFNTHHITIQNVKICNGRVWNDDGIDIVNSSDILIDNCFIRTDDDCIALKGMEYIDASSNIERIRVENTILWCDRARAILLGHECRAEHMKDIHFRNIDIVHFNMVPFLLEPGEDMKINNVVFENIRLNGEGQKQFIRLLPVINNYMHRKVPGYIENIAFKDIMIRGIPGEYGIEIRGFDETYGVNGVSFSNIQFPGGYLKEDSPDLHVGNYVNDIAIGIHSELAYERPGLKWIKVDGGSFYMGSNYGESHEQPVHQVFVDAFEITQYEIKVSAYFEFCRVTGRNMPMEPSWGWISEHPIVNVSWEDARDFATWMGGRLPTSAEWEFAARGGNHSQEFMWSGSNSIDTIAWYHKNSQGSGTKPVGLK